MGFLKGWLNEPITTTDENGEEIAVSAKDYIKSGFDSGDKAIDTANDFKNNFGKDVNPLSGSASGNKLKTSKYTAPSKKLSLGGNNQNPIDANKNISGDAGYYEEDIASIKHKDKEGNEHQVGERPYSLFNKYSLVNYRGNILDAEGSSAVGKSKHYNKIHPNSLINPSVTKIIELTGGTTGYQYSYSDFALAKYFGKIPNNQMITLRRFAFPTPDDVINPVSIKGENVPQPDVARAVTWMGPATGNELNSILQFSHGYNWKEATAEVQTLQSQKSASSGKLGGLLNGEGLLNAAANAANDTNAYDKAVKDANAGYDAFSETYPNHVFGPLNVIKQVLQRDQGLNFTHEFSLKFEYELRDLGGANPKVLMLDQLANILALTYNNAPFWGGDVRYVGDGTVAKPLGDLDKLKNGDPAGFLKSVVNDLSGNKGGDGSTWDMMGGVVDGMTKFVKEGGIGKTLNNVLGGSLMKMFNSPQGAQAVNALLTGDPTGQWHVTIGNPLNPIAVIGNLACTDTKVSFEGGMGVQDFPEKLVVEISLKPGRPRDKSEIESMFNSGRGRFYLQPDDGTKDINNEMNPGVYAGKDKKDTATKANPVIRKIANG
jgi:hypothetical protein